MKGQDNIEDEACRSRLSTSICEKKNLACSRPNWRTLAINGTNSPHLDIWIDSAYTSLTEKLYWTNKADSSWQRQSFSRNFKQVRSSSWGVSAHTAFPVWSWRQCTFKAVATTSWKWFSQSKIRSVRGRGHGDCFWGHSMTFCLLIFRRAKGWHLLLIRRVLRKLAKS